MIPQEIDFRPSHMVMPRVVTATPLNPHPYSIANPAPGFSPIQTYRGEFFEVADDRTSRYSEVSWHSVPVGLPADIVARFDGKVMAITGYEVDVVRIDNATGAETRAPCYELYNHHFTAFLHSSDVELASGASGQIGPHGQLLPRWRKIGRAATDGDIPSFPHVQPFSESNGNEHRRSFKGCTAVSESVSVVCAPPSEAVRILVTH